MSLYNMVNGVNLNAAFCLKMLGLKPRQIPRFRDAWLTDDGTQIVLLTRTGGGNRSAYERENEGLTSIEGYAGNEDDAFDSTFAKFMYAVKDEYLPFTTKLAPLMKELDRGADQSGPGATVRKVTKQKEHQPLTSSDPRVKEAASLMWKLGQKLGMLSPGEQQG